MLAVSLKKNPAHKLNMAKKDSKEIVYKEQVTHLLLLLLEIADHDTKYSKDFEEDYRKRLKFQKQTDWKRFRACIDLLDDTDYAIVNCFEYQLGDLKTKKNDIGEIYLRLYGVLNAVYLQMNAYSTLSNLLNYPNRELLQKEFERLDIYKLRGIAGAHTVDYLYDKETLEANGLKYKTTSFRIVQMYLERTGSKIVALDENGISYEFNLLEILIQYENIARQLLVRLIEHSIKTLVYEKETKQEIKNRLNDLLPSLLDYKSLNKNEKHKEREYKRWKKLTEKYLKTDDLVE